MRALPAVLSLALVAVACGPKTPPAPPETEQPTAADAAAFVERVDAEVRALYQEATIAQWSYATNINDETAAKVQDVTERALAMESRIIEESKAFLGVDGIDPVTARKLLLIRTGATSPAPDDDAQRAELARILTEIEGMYGAGEYCETEGGEEVCHDLGHAEKVLAMGAETLDADAQLAAWKGWRTISPAMREKYQRFVEIGNAGSEEIGFDDMGVLWRSRYDMAPDAFDAEVERLWQQVKPLYEKLHCHVRAELSEAYGPDVVKPDGPIPAHLLGNMWAQSWENLYPLLVPYPDEPSLDVNAAIAEKKWDWKKMVVRSEDFFTGLGLRELPDTFWQNSMFLKPDDRDVVCHASAWDMIRDPMDVRIKMCIKTDYEDLITIHHELGHVYYYMYYHDLPLVFQTGAHDGFHEGIGDTLALSITPGYLKDLGLLDEVSETPEGLLNKQMQDALAKIAFLPFGRMIDKWRWGVFSGEIPADQYNAGWWDLRTEYQGIAPPIPRSEADFDPGAKYHIPGNTPYMRYFLSHVLQFQFHEALCEAAGHEGPLHTCSIAGSKEAGEKMAAMLALGASQPWPDALEAIAGTRQMDAGPLLDFFSPLESWLDEQNAGRTCGW